MFLWQISVSQSHARCTWVNHAYLFTCCGIHRIKKSVTVDIFFRGNDIYTVILPSPTYVVNKVMLAYLASNLSACYLLDEYICMWYLQFKHLINIFPHNIIKTYFTLFSPQAQMCAFNSLVLWASVHVMEACTVPVGGVVSIAMQ